MHLHTYILDGIRSLTNKNNRIHCTFVVDTECEQMLHLLLNMMHLRKFLSSSHAVRLRYDCFILYTLFKYDPILE